MSVIAEERIRHNGNVFEAGDLIEDISNKDAKRLVDLGSAKPYQEKKVKRSRKKSKFHRMKVIKKKPKNQKVNNHA
jgi:hypothetical protein